MYVGHYWWGREHDGARKGIFTEISTMPGSAHTTKFLNLAITLRQGEDPSYI